MELDGATVTACFFAFEAFLNVFHSWIVLFETPNFCTVTDLRPVRSDVLPRLHRLYWTRSHETNASRYRNVSKSSVLIYFSSFFMYALLYVFIHFLQKRTNMYILCWFVANFKTGKEPPPPLKTNHKDTPTFLLLFFFHPLGVALT